MKNKCFVLKEIILVLCLLTSAFAFSQVGIGTETPDASSILDMQSNSQGLLAPRMTTLERNVITSPAESLLVFDITEKAFYFYNTSIGSWTKLANDSSVKRTNYKLIKSAADLAQELSDGGGTSYLLNTNTYYEINGTIPLTKPIDLNNAYVSGLDANEDVLSSTGVVFKGNTGGSIRNLTLTGTKAFEITGPGIATNSSLIIQNTIVAGMTSSVGSISGLGLYFGNIVQFVSNTNGITYSDIGNLLLDNQAWLNSNNGTFETFSGNFGLIEKASGFSTGNGADVALDVSNSNLAVGTGILQGTVFTGISSSPFGYVKEYTSGSYIGFNFNKAWTVSAPGIPREDDDIASGNLYFDSAAVINVNNTAAFKLPVNTSAIRLFRTAEGTGVNSENRLIYEGEGRREINVLGAISFTATSGSRYTFSIYKSGVKVIGSDVIADVLQTNARQSVSIIGTVDVVKDDYIEIYVQKTTPGSEQFLITSYNLIVN